VHIDVSQRKKLGDKAWKGVFVGYAFDSPAWLVYNPVTRRVIRSRNAVIDEDWMKAPSISLPPQTDEEEGEEEDEGTVPSDPAPFPVHQDPVKPGDAPPEELPDPPMAPEVAPTRLERLQLERIARIAEAPRTRSERAQAYQAGLIADMPSLGTAALAAVCEPASYLRAMRSPEKSKWEAVVNEEYRSLTSNST
jgi:hypothetical protein